MLLILVLLSACHDKSNNLSIVIAKYKDKELTNGDILNQLPANVDSTDSIRYTKLYASQWIQEQVLTDKAFEIVGDLKNQILPKVEDYKRKLAILALNRFLIDKQLDTIITPQQITEYYDAHKSEYVNKTTLYQYSYVRTSNQDTPELRLRLVSEDPKDKTIVLEWCKKNAIDYKLDESWVDELTLSKLPAAAGCNSAFFIPNKQVCYYTQQVSGKQVLIFFTVNRILKVGEALPIKMIQDKIKNQILELRKQTLLKQYQENALKEALANQDIQQNI